MIHSLFSFLLPLLFLVPDSPPGVDYLFSSRLVCPLLVRYAQLLQLRCTLKLYSIRGNPTSASRSSGPLLTSFVGRFIVGFLVQVAFRYRAHVSKSLPSRARIGAHWARRSTVTMSVFLTRGCPRQAATGAGAIYAHPSSRPDSIFCVTLDDHGRLNQWHVMQC